jgi:transposase
MIVVGVDAHKQLHVARALNEVGKLLGNWQGSNTIEGWEKFTAWLQKLGGPCQIGIEGAHSYGYGLAQWLVGEGFTVFDVNPRLTAGQRRFARRTDKNDRLDAEAVAKTVLQLADRLPQVRAEDPSTVARLLHGERKCVIEEMTRLRNRLHAALFEIDPTYKSSLPKLTSKAAIAVLATWEPEHTRVMHLEERLQSIRRMNALMELLVAQEADLKKRIEKFVRAQYAPLTTRRGVKAVTAAAIAAKLGPAGRFVSDSQVAALAGTAPLEVSSAGKTRHRLSRQGDREFNSIIHNIAMTQARCYQPAIDYLAKRRAEGRTKQDAMRALKRYIARAVFQDWLRCFPSSTSPSKTPHAPSSSSA